MKLSIYYGKQITGANGKCGYVLSVNALGKKIVSLLCADGAEKEFYADAEGLKFSKGKITFKKLTTACGEPVRLGKPVFDCEGQYLGKLTDFIAENNVLKFALVGNKKFSADDIVSGDAVIVKSSARVLKSDVKKNGRVLLRRGNPLTPEALEKAQANGEYVQANLKTI